MSHFKIDAGLIKKTHNKSCELFIILKKSDA